MTIVVAILIFGVLIFVHEFGHFITAKAAGIRVIEFAVGMGPVLLHMDRGETKYSLRAFPIGGFCSMEGENGDSENDDAFSNKPFLAKALVLVAGSTMNLLFAVLITILLYFSIGVATNGVESLTEGGPAMQAGIQPGDKIVQVDDMKVNSLDELISSLNSVSKDTASVTVDRNGESKEFLVGVETANGGQKIIGVTLARTKNPINVIEAGTESVAITWHETIKGLGMLFTGKASVSHLTGPVGIVSMVGDTVEMGMAYVVSFAAFISLNLAIVNMLPIPALDGGRLLFLVIRAFAKKNLSDKIETKFHLVGMVFLLGLMIFITYQDIGRLMK